MTSKAFCFPEGLKQSQKAHRARPIYAALQPHEQADLLIITHFMHVHYKFLKLSPHDLLTPVEESILARRGKAYDSILSSISTVVSDDDYLASLRHGVDELASTGKFREACMSGSCINNSNIHPSARPMSVYDSRGMKYVWVRGSAGVSTRFLAGEKVLDDPLEYAEYLRRRGGRKDVFVSGWIASRVESAERKAMTVKQEFEKECMKRRLVEEAKRVGKIEKERRMERLGHTLGAVVEGGRRRREVRYVESDHDDESGNEDEETGDDEFMICEEVLDEGSGDDSCDSGDVDDENGEMNGGVVVGRVRVHVSERAQRAARRAERFMGKGKRLRSGRVMKENVGEELTDCRRSKRLRGISA